MHAKCWYRSDSCSGSAAKAGLTWRLSQCTRCVRGGVEFFPLLPQPWIQDNKKAWFKLETQRERMTPLEHGKQDLLPLTLIGASQACVSICPVLPYYHIWMGGDEGDRSPSSFWVHFCSRQLRLVLKKLLPAQILGQLGVLGETRWGSLINGHYFAHTR